MIHIPGFHPQFSQFIWSSNTEYDTHAAVVEFLYALYIEVEKNCIDLFHNYYSSEVEFFPSPYISHTLLFYN